jgi:hypothetical protein
MKNITRFFYILLLSAMPLIASAQLTEFNTQYVSGYSNSIIGVINNYLVPVLLALAFIVFLWGVFKNFIWKAESGEAHTEGSKFVAWGLIGFVVILSLWGLVNVVAVTLGLGNPSATPGSIPSAPGSNPDYEDVDL